MRRLLSRCLVLLVLAAFTGCGNKADPQEGSAQETQDAAPATPSTSVPAETAEEAPAPATSAEGDAESPPPAEQLSETDDPVEAAPQADSGVQPSLRLGGPAPQPPSRQFKEGVNYKRVVPAQRTDVEPGKVQVLEMFWYGCGHCYALDPAVASWERNGKPEFVEFARVPVMWGNIQRLHARAYYTAELLGKLDQLHTQIFRAIHAEGNMLDTEDKIRAFFTAHGVSDADFKRMFSSFGVENKLKRAEFLGRAYRVDSVPMFAINGKYTTSVSDAGGERQLFSLLNEIAAAERDGG
jgi:thiol:disulfide interchange protein DsbA